MPRGDKSKYSDKQKRKAEHIEEGYENRGVPAKEAARRAWATVNKESGGGKKSGSGRGKRESHASSRKGGKKGSLAINPQAAQRIREYLAKAGHQDDLEGPLFRPVRGNREGQDERRHLHPDVIDRILRKYARRIGLDRGYSAHSMRGTFITTALDNGASLEEVQPAAGHADPSTTKLYDRRGYNPEKSASFFANY